MSDTKPVVTLKIPDGVEVSDGYHTFSELYDHRIELWIALLKRVNPIAYQVWRSRLHSDGSSFEGWFILGSGKMRGSQLSYHLPMDKWDACNFAETLERAPDFDGHTSADVLARLRRL